MRNRLGDGEDLYSALLLIGVVLENSLMRCCLIFRFLFSFFVIYLDPVLTHLVALVFLIIFATAPDLVDFFCCPQDSTRRSKATMRGMREYMRRCDAILTVYPGDA